MKFPSEQEMRVRFHQIRQEIADLEAEIKPTRDKYDQLTAGYHKNAKPLIDKLKEADKPLFALKNEMGKIVRVLGGQTAMPQGDK